MLIMLFIAWLSYFCCCSIWLHTAPFSLSAHVVQPVKAHEKKIECASGYVVSNFDINRDSNSHVEAIMRVFFSLCFMGWLYVQFVWLILFCANEVLWN